jgi:hypothetical protein
MIVIDADGTPSGLARRAPLAADRDEACRAG